MFSHEIPPRTRAQSSQQSSVRIVARTAPGFFVNKSILTRYPGANLKLPGTKRFSSVDKMRRGCASCSWCASADAPAMIPRSIPAPDPSKCANKSIVTRAPGTNLKPPGTKRFKSVQGLCLVLLVCLRRRSSAADWSDPEMRRRPLLEAAAEQVKPC